MSVESQPSATGGLLSADAPPHWRASVLNDVKHGFFGRRGGVSTGIYASLNAGTGSNDDPDAARENRTRIAAAFGAPLEHLLGPHQVHSSIAMLVDGPWQGDRPHVDALVTTTPGLVLSVLSADCTPVLLADTKRGVIGAAHAGWKGALAGMVDAVVSLMEGQGARAGDIAAAIGPCIHQASYEVGPEFEAAFAERGPGLRRFFKPGKGDRRYFDLPGYCASRLEAMGVGRIEVLNLDTCALADDLFSNRRAFLLKEGDYGRNCSAICL